jgi:hypothetical protein
MDLENYITKAYFLVKGCKDEEIKAFEKRADKGLRQLSQYQLEDLINTIYDLENSDDESEEYKKYKFQIINTLNSL